MSSALPVTALNSDEKIEEANHTPIKTIRTCMAVAALLAFVFSILNLNDGSQILGWIDAGVMMTLALSIWWSYHSPSIKFLENITILHAAIFFLFLFFHGGSVGIGYIWAVSFPFIVCIVGGSRTGLWCAAIFALITATCGLIIQHQHIEVALDWGITPYLATVYTFFTVIAYFVILSKEKSEKLTRRVKTELGHKAEALAESESRYRMLLDSTPSAVGVHRDGKWVYVNHATVKQFGADRVEEILGTPLLDYVHPGHHAMVKERIQIQVQKKVAVPTVEEKLIRKNGEVFTAEVQSRPIMFKGKPSFLVNCLDISERKEHEEERLLLQKQLDHAQRLESLGVLAGGIAHDFNNLLAAIMGNAELARMVLIKDPVAATNHLNHVEKSCDSAAKLCKQMMAYAGKGSYLRETLDINSTVRSMSKLLRASVKSNITLKVKLNRTLPNINGDVTQIQQVILNFIINSAEAIGDANGEIYIATRTIQAKRDTLNGLYNGAALSEGEYVVFEVRDNGCGMDEEMQKKIFDPFFTTKDTGTGLGLSAVLGIIRAHKGAIQLESRPGMGTIIQVLIPPVDQPVATRIVVTGEVLEWQGEGTILIADDDPTVLTVASELSKRLQFDVITASDGVDAVNVFHRHHQNIVAVLLDITMPRLGGVDAMREMRGIDSSIPIILVSGYNEAESERLAKSLAKSEKSDAFIQKPFKSKDLKKCLYRVLHEAN